MNDLVSKFEEYDATIVIPTFNRSDRLFRCLQAVGEQDLSTYKVEAVVVDDGSEDDTVSMVNGLAAYFPMPLRVISNKGKGPASARNAGMAAAASPLILYTDDDCVPQPTWVFFLIEYFHKHPEIDAVGGEIQRLYNTNISRYIDDSGFMRQTVEGKAVKFLVTANAGFRKQALLNVQGFDERISIAGGEDFELSYRIRKEGSAIAFVPGAVIKHEHHQRLRALHKMNWRHGKGFAFQRDLGVPGEYPGRQDLRWSMERCRDAYQAQVVRGSGSLKKRLFYWFLDMYRWWSFHLGYNS